MKKFISLLMIMMMFSFMALSCSKDESAAEPESSDEVYYSEQGLVDEDGNPVENEGSGIVFEEEDEDAQLTFVEKDPSEFFGTWESTSDQSIYLYGNVTLTINPDGTWKGDITDEQLEGKWTKDGDHLHMDNDLFSFDLSFESSGKLILREASEDSEFHTVLTKK